jgi:hypothetical protein
LTISAQYTETINSNRPGASTGAFSVGVNVLQGEGGFYTIKNNHELRDATFKGWGFGYEFRYGLLWEQLELNLQGSFQSGTRTFNASSLPVAGKLANFTNNTFGVKYLFYDPWKDREEEKPNLYSWKANKQFKWKSLIPALSGYAGVNFNISDTPFVYGSNFNFSSITEPTISPKIMLMSQNNWSGGWVFVINLIGDRLFMTDYPIFSYILTLTHSFHPQWSIFIEHQGIKNDIYADSLIRTGGAYLLSKDFQLDTGITFNTKNSPTFFSVNLGVSYRYDMHTDPEDNGTDAEDELEKKENKEGKNRKKKNNRKKKKKGAKIDSKRDKDIPDFDDDE